MGAIGLNFISVQIELSGEWVRKDPVGDHSKMSKRGHLALTVHGIGSDARYVTVPEDSLPSHKNLLVPVFSDGKLLQQYTFSNIRANSERTVNSVGRAIPVVFG